MSAKVKASVLKERSILFLFFKRDCQTTLHFATTENIYETSCDGKAEPFRERDNGAFYSADALSADTCTRVYARSRNQWCPGMKYDA